MRPINLKTGMVPGAHDNKPVPALTGRKVMEWLTRKHP
jgi:hypothetical protein